MAVGWPEIKKALLVFTGWQESTLTGINRSECAGLFANKT